MKGAIESISSDLMMSEKENFTEDEINGMTPEDLADRAAQIRQDQVSIFDNFADAGVALGGLLMSGGAIAFGFATGNFPNTNPNAPQNPMPPAPVATEPKPTRKEEEGEEVLDGDGDNSETNSEIQMIDLGTANLSEMPAVGGFEVPNSSVYSGEILIHNPEASIESSEIIFDSSEQESIGSEVEIVNDRQFIEDKPISVAERDAQAQLPDFISEPLKGYIDPPIKSDNPNSMEALMSWHIINKYNFSGKEYDTYSSKVKNLEENNKKTEPKISVKTENLLVSEQAELTKLREKRKQLAEEFKHKIAEDIKKSSSDSAYKESNELLKSRKDYEKNLRSIDEQINQLNKKAEKPFQVPKTSKEITSEATSLRNYEKIMGLSREQAIERNRKLTEEQIKKEKADKALQDQRSKIIELDKAFESLEKIKSTLTEAEVSARRITLQEIMADAKKEYGIKLEKQETVYKDAFERKTNESKALLDKIYGDQIKAKEAEIERLKTSDKTKDIESVKKFTKEIEGLRKTRDEAIATIDNKYKSSTFITLDSLKDSIPDKDARFHDPKVLVDRYTDSNLIFINTDLYKNDERGIPDFTMKEISGNPPKQQLVLKDSAGKESGVIILGTEKVFQHDDYGAKVYVVSDRKEDLPHGTWNEDLGKVVYKQDGSNTCQSYTLLGQMVQEGVKFRDNTEDGRKLIHELTRLQFQQKETGNMSADTINAYNRILDGFGLKATDITSHLETKEAKQNAIKEKLRQGKIVNSGMYLDAPPGKVELDKDGREKAPGKGHRVNIVGFDDVRGEWIVNDSNQKGDLTRYKYGDFELGNRWSTVLEKK